MLPHCVFYDHIIDIYFDIPTDLVNEHFFHHALVRCSGVLETECRLLVVDSATIGVKGRFILIFSSHLDLMVALIGIKETVELKTFQGTNLFIYPREGQ